jgi:hypothetical protein
LIDEGGHDHTSLHPPPPPSPHLDHEEEENIPPPSLSHHLDEHVGPIPHPPLSPHLDEQEGPIHHPSSSTTDQTSTTIVYMHIIPPNGPYMLYQLFDLSTIASTTFSIDHVDDVLNLYVDFDVYIVGSC